MSLNELNARMQEAITKNDVKAIEAIASEIVKSKTDRAKAEAEGLRKEAEALAGTREKLATSIHKAIKEIGLDRSLTDVKAWGFTYKVDKANPAEPDISYKSASLLTQQVKARKGGTGGGAGKTKDELGMSLQEVYDKFAGADEQAKMVEAEDKDTAASAKLGHATNSNAWRVKNEVKKRVLAEGLLAPTK